jgi:hypothetical protein
MNRFFEAKAKYNKTLENGKDKVVTELYLLSAVSLTDTETSVNNELSAFITGEFDVISGKVSNVSEVIGTEGEWFFDAVVVITEVNEKSGKPKDTNIQVLVQANDILEAQEKINKAWSDSVSEFRIKGIKESNFVDVIGIDSEVLEQTEGVEPTGED